MAIRKTRSTDGRLCDGRLAVARIYLKTAEHAETAEPDKCSIGISAISVLSAVLGYLLNLIFNAFSHCAQVSRLESVWSVRERSIRYIQWPA